MPAEKDKKIHSIIAIISYLEVERLRIQTIPQEQQNFSTPFVLFCQQ